VNKLLTEPAVRAIDAVLTEFVVVAPLSGCALEEIPIALEDGLEIDRLTDDEVIALRPVPAWVLEDRVAAQRKLRGPW
jgi:hypothetical protein